MFVSILLFFAVTSACSFETGTCHWSLFGESYSWVLQKASEATETYMPTVDHSTGSSTGKALKKINISNLLLPRVKNDKNRYSRIVTEVVKTW